MIIAYIVGKGDKTRFLNSVFFSNFLSLETGLKEKKGFWNEFSPFQCSLEPCQKLLQFYDLIVFRWKCSIELVSVNFRV